MRSTKRRTLTVLLAATATAVAMTTLGMWPANAVYNVGVFQLDGDASSATQAFGPAAPDDWDKVCHQATAQCASATNTTNATAVGFINDGPQNGSIYTGGGSKDPLPIGGWSWKDQLGGLPDKDNLQDSFAARYSITPTTLCPSNGLPKCDLLYFGSDRFDNSGDAQQGFWFFQKKVSLTNAATGKFVGGHTNGDLLIVSDFSNGGTTSTINLYKWVCSAASTCDSTGSLSFITGGDNEKCGGSNSVVPFCGIVNPTDGTAAPWSFLDKSGNHSFLQGELYEGGVNLSDPSINLSSECFSSFLSETRSSTSTTATLKDFVLGQFAQCGATMSTNPVKSSDGSSVSQSTITPGTAVHDVATVVGTGTSSAPTPTGTVNFFLCSFAAGTTTLCDGNTPATLGVAAGSGTLSGTGQVQGTAVASSSDVNTAAAPSLPGRYCYRSEWSGDSNYVPDAPATKFVHTSPAECFTIATIDTTTVTTPSNSSSVSLGGTAHLGDTIYDYVEVTGTAAGGVPTGTVNFRVCDPTQVTGTSGNEICPLPSGGTAAGSPTLTTKAGSTTVAKALSNGVSVTRAGVWCFSGSYVHTGSIYNDSSDNSHSECVTVPPDSTTTTTTPQSGGSAISGDLPVNSVVSDHAVVQGTAGGGTPTGAVTFYICSPSQTTPDASNNPTCSSGGTQVGSSAVTLTAGSGNSATADSVTTTATSVGVWCFRAVFAPASNNPNYTGSSDGRNSECFRITDSTAVTSQQTWLPNDSGAATSTGGTALNGTLTFTLYTGDNCGVTSGAATAYSKSFNLTNEASGTSHSTDNSSVSVSTSQSVSWLVQFTSSDPLVSGNSHCEKTALTINN